MLKIFPIDFIRQALEQELLKEHIKNPNYFGGTNQVNLFSFYEQLKTQDEVDRFVENYRELSEQQNRTGLILNGVLVSPENPSITNIYSSLIIPMTFTCSFRCMLENRDQAIETINNLIEELKGRKVDIAQLKCTDLNGKTCYKPFVVGTIGENDGAPKLRNGDYLGDFNSQNLQSQISAKLLALYNLGVTYNIAETYWFYANIDGVLSVLYWLNNSWTPIVDDGTYPNVIFPPEHDSFEKYKLSFSFDAIRCDEPRNLNANEYCEITFSGSATLVSNGVALGNDLLKIFVSKIGYMAETFVSFDDIQSENKYAWLEPLEMPSGSNANTKLNQLVSNRFKTNTHTDSLTLTLQYTFILDRNISLLNQWFNYARYGTQGLTVNDITPNLIYGINELWCSWGDFEVKEIKAKIVENIDIENTESDTLTLSVTMQIQGDNIGGNGGLS